jgi:light-regulated signal transduction histidine kinase (bacteriophytochrome)
VQGDELRRLAAGDGVAVVQGERVLRFSRTPAEKEVRTLAQHVQKADQPLVFWDNLATQFPDVAIDPALASGVLAVHCEGAPATTVLWFRPEIIEVIEWGGEPRKAIEAAGAGFAIHPRKSFEIWRETVRGRSRPWEPAVIAIAKDFREALLKLVLRRRS